MLARSMLRAALICAAVAAAIVGLNGGGPAARAAASPHLRLEAPAASVSPIAGPPGYAMQEPVAGSPAAPAALGPLFAFPHTPIIGSYTHTGAASPAVDLPPGNGDIMPSTTLHYVFWLPTGLHYESNAAGDTNYENILIQWANDLGSSQFHNLVTQYFGNNGSISNTVGFGGSWTDTAADPHAGTTG